MGYKDLNSGKNSRIGRHVDREHNQVSLIRGSVGQICYISDARKRITYDQRKPIQYQGDLFDPERVKFFCDYCQLEVDHIHPVTFEITNPPIPTRRAHTFTISCCSSCNEDDIQFVKDKLFKGAIVEKRTPWYERYDPTIDVSFKTVLELREKGLIP